MSITIHNEDILLPSIDLVIEWMGGPSLATIYTNSTKNSDFISHGTLNKVAAGSITIQKATQRKIDTHFAEHHPEFTKQVRAFFQGRTGTIGLGGMKWLGYITGLPTETKTEYPYTLSVIQALIELEMALTAAGKATLAAASKPPAIALAHPALTLLDLNAFPQVQINSLLLILSAFDAEYSIGSWLTEDKLGTLSGLLRFKRQAPIEDYNGALWQWLLQLIEAQNPSINSWNRLDQLLAEKWQCEQESIERKLRRYRTNKNDKGFNALMDEICKTCWENSDDAGDIAATFNLLNQGTTLLDHLSSDGFDMVSIEDAYIEYYAFHAEKLTGA